MLAGTAERGMERDPDRDRHGEVIASLHEFRARLHELVEDSARAVARSDELIRESRTLRGGGRRDDTDSDDAQGGLHGGSGNRTDAAVTEALSVARRRAV
jgi:hypothetical protein